MIASAVARETRADRASSASVALSDSCRPRRIATWFNRRRKLASPLSRGTNPPDASLAVAPPPGGNC